MQRFTSRSPAVRRGAAALTALVVLVLPLRVGLGCEMMANVPVAMSAELSTPSGTDEHHHHHSGESVPADSPQKVPQRDLCTDLMHCAVAALPATTAVLEPAWVGITIGVSANAIPPVSVALPLEPPPPRV